MHTPTDSAPMARTDLTHVVIVCEFNGITSAWGWGATEAQARAMNDHAPELEARPCSAELVAFLSSPDCPELPDLDDERWWDHIGEASQTLDMFPDAAGGTLF